MLYISDRLLYGCFTLSIISKTNKYPLGILRFSLIHAGRICIATTITVALQPCLRSAIRQFHPSLINTKLAALSGFNKGLRRALGLTRLSQAVVSIIHDPERVQQMLDDISRLDLGSIEVSWQSPRQIRSAAFVYGKDGEIRSRDSYNINAVILFHFSISP